MATSSTSYLQTLTKDEAIAFIASLQSVKAHLSQELQWMEAQVQQKTAQLQGIETLLLEATTLGLVTAARPSIAEATSTPIPTSTPTATGDSQETTLEHPGTAPERTALVEATEPVAAAIAALPAKKPSKQLRGSTGKAGRPKGSRDSKPSASTKPSTGAAKQSTPATPPASTSQRGKASGLQQFLKSQWRDEALTASVSTILNRATSPMTTDEMMAALYDGLPQEDYDRAKHSLANILSVGRSKGSWKSAGRGLYAGSQLANT